MDTKIRELDAEGVRAFLDRRRGVLVDTLPPEHFAARHIPGAVNACVYEMVFAQTMDGLAPDRAAPVLLYGAGPASGDCRCAADKLMRAGYRDVAVFPGGLEAWREQGLPLAGEDPDAVEPPHPLLVLEPRTYRVVPGESVVRWTGRNTNGGHHGLLTVSGGFLDASGEEPAASFTLNMASLRDLDLEGDPLKPVLEAHLRSDDFFFTERFPEALFTTTRLRIAELAEATRPNAMLQGVLALRGMESEIAFPAHVRNLADGRIVVMGNLDLDRTHWGVVYGSSSFFHHLAYHVVFDFVSADFRVVLA